MVQSSEVDPVVYLSVPKRRKGTQVAKEPGAAQLEILLQILGPFASELVSLYFRFMHSAFPSLDEEPILRALRSKEPGVSPSLLCDLLTVSLRLWNRSPKLRKHPRPDVQYAWNLAVAALNDEFQAPSLSTVQAAVLDLGGLPVLSVKLNIVNLGRTMSLAHSFGLNRDPSSWNLSTADKCLRIRLWWTLYIHDRWASFAHGLPPYIVQNQHDVPLPSIQTLRSGQDTDDEAEKTANCFVHLCTLTCILGELLPFVYHLGPCSDDLESQMDRIDEKLESWVLQLPPYLCPNEGPPQVPGSSNLWFDFLSLKLLTRRFRLQSGRKSGLQKEARRHLVSEICEAARQSVQFICSLGGQQFHDFWLPYTAHLLPMTANVLLRCMLETKGTVTAGLCRQSLSSLQESLHDAQAYGWDVENLFMDQCDAAVTKMTRSQSASSPEQYPQASEGSEGPSTAPRFQADALLETDFWDLDDIFGSASGLSFAPLWDGLDDAGDMQL